MAAQKSRAAKDGDQRFERDGGHMCSSPVGRGIQDRPDAVQGRLTPI
jgi:hypothetical protein